MFIISVVWNYRFSGIKYIHIHHLYLYPKLFHHPQQKNLLILPPPPFFQSLATSIPLCVSTNLPILGISYKWENNVFVLCLDAWFQGLLL